MTVTIRSAVPADAALIIRFIEALAAYEKLSHEAKATEADILRDLFGADPKVFCEIAEADGRPVGFALWFYTYSTFQGRHGIWLEDLFVDPESWRRGIGARLMAEAERRARALGVRSPHVIAHERAQAFYERCGFRVTGTAMTALAPAPEMRKDL